MKKAIRHTYTQNKKFKTHQQNVERKKMFYFQVAFFFAIIGLEPKEADKVFLLNQQTNEVKSR